LNLVRQHEHNTLKEAIHAEGEAMVNQSNSPTPATANGVANGKPSANNSSQSSPAPTVSNADGNAKAKPSRRVDVEPLMKELHRRLGPNWDRYRDAVTDFVIGQLNRAEFDDELDGIVVGGTIKLHNQFMLSVLTNALRDPPPNTTLEWSRKRKDPTKAATRGDPRIKTLKAEVMAIPAKERRRIKGSAKEAAKRHTVVHPSCMLESRVAKLPRIPIVKDKVTSAFFTSLPANTRLCTDDSSGVSCTARHLYALSPGRRCPAG